MELTKELTVERMPTQTTISLAEREGLEASELDERELNEKLIEILKERIDEGNTQARFQLGQLYFEKVNFNINIQIYNLYCIYKYTVYTVYIYNFSFNFSTLQTAKCYKNCFIVFCTNKITDKKLILTFFLDRL